ncbi:alpha/beta fold hydrolase [Methylobacterium sp. WL64]|uniref:alpha/beta fold hydrolase n=1 Tax=Methylobacterium sp. WL64 TaxID=2603894 RepID=UPI00164FFF42|nr:alpha/beta hydrolase [Methylobacterium sp. WL64]
MAIETFIDGAGPPFVILSSYGRDGGTDYDDITGRLVEVGWQVLRPQPRGVAGSTGPMRELTLHDLADDVAMCLRALAEEPVVILGHAFGNVLARVVTTDHPELVRAVVLAAAEGSEVPPEIGKAPSIVSNPSEPEAERLATLRKAFFAPDHDPSVWLNGWYHDTYLMQHEAVKASGLKDSWACGTVPLLQIIADHDPFIPAPYWKEMTDQLGARVTKIVVSDASHALFPEQPGAVAEAVLTWAQQWR